MLDQIANLLEQVRTAPNMLNETARDQNKASESNLLIYSLLPHGWIGFDFTNQLLKQTPSFQ